jgi:hypothetical protein
LLSKKIGAEARSLEHRVRMWRIVEDCLRWRAAAATALAAMMGIAPPGRKPQ